MSILTAEMFFVVALICGQCVQLCKNCHCFHKDAHPGITCWLTEEPGRLQSMGSQRVVHD